MTSWPYLSGPEPAQVVGGGPPPPTYLFEIRHEGNDFSEYDSTSSGSGALSIAAGAALKASNFGLSVYNPGGTNAILYARKNLTGPFNHLRVRFYIDPNSVAMADSQVPTAVSCRQGGTNAFKLALRKVGAQYSVRFTPASDTADLTYQTVNITDDPHYIEIHLARAATNVSADGAISWWIDGVAQTGWTGVDNYDRMAGITLIDFGAPVSAPTTTVTGTWYIDEIAANDTGVEIGP